MLTKKYDTSAESQVPGAVPGVGLMLIASVLCSKNYLFEIFTRAAPGSSLVSF